MTTVFLRPPFAPQKVSKSTQFRELRSISKDFFHICFFRKMKKVDFFGRDYHTNSFYLEIYDDGSIEKKYHLIK